MKEQLAILQDSEKGHTEALQLLQRQLTETKVQLLQTSGSLPLCPWAVSASSLLLSSSGLECWRDSVSHPYELLLRFFLRGFAEAEGDLPLVTTCSALTCHRNQPHFLKLLNEC